MVLHTYALVIFIALVCFAKAKNCTIADARVQNTTMKIINKNCTTFSSTPCEKTENIRELQLSHNLIGELNASMFTCLRDLTDLHIDNNKISKLKQEAFSTLPALERLDLRDNLITEIGHRAFEGARTLKQLDLENNSLQKIDPGAFDSLVSLNNLKLKNNRLLELPELYRFNTKLTTLDVSNNPVKRLDARILGKYGGLMRLYLRKTDIESLPDNVFRNNSELKLLSLRESKLKKIEQKAFAGTRLKTLDLMGIKITELPGEDLEHLHHLVIKGVKDLWTLPIVSFKNLQIASVEYAFHCCLIKTEVSGYRGLVGTPSTLTGSFSTINTCPNKVYQPVTQPAPTFTTTEASNSKRSIDNSSETIPLPSCIPPHWKIVTRPTALPPLNCTPKEDAFNPCGDLLGSLALRICSWFVLVLALLGNAFKLFVLLASKRKMTIYKILMCNLALANLCMGVFLCMLASADLHSLGAYQNFAKEWQYRNGCRAAGFLSIFSTELAGFVLTVITLERYFMIVHPLNHDKHLNTNQVVVLVVVGWLFSATMAALPLFDVSSYEKVAICLPFDVEDAVSRGYVTFLLVTNGLAFFFVLFCYGRMYCSLGGSRSSSSDTRVEGRVAKRMAMLVFTNFVCWFPIALVSLIAIYGEPLVGVAAAKFFLVFVYPINSFTNPYLYAIGTKNFQLDALEIFRQLGICNASIAKLTNRLRDQLDTLPISSRGQTGSRLSLSSVRSPSQSLGFGSEGVRAVFSREDGGKSNGNASRGSSHARLSRSSKTNSSCSPCNLAIPLIHKKTRELPRKCSEDSRCGYNAVNMHRKPSKKNSLDQETLSVRRTSAQDIVLAGSSYSKPGSEEAANGGLSRLANHGENSTGEGSLKASNSEDTSFQVPTVMLTTH